jgi:Holliday junction resolvasome RuvABC ATP-dependent DNA helicase subunit
MKTPEELYPLIDSQRYVIILATNDVSPLPEALVNRSMEFIFGEYTKEELLYISNNLLLGTLSNQNQDYLIECAAKNPRILKSLCVRINLISRSYPNVWNMDIKQFNMLIRDLFGIEDGLDMSCRRYVEALDHLGGRASLDTLSIYLHIDKDTLRYFVEPILLYKNLIQITSRGRTLCR